MKTNPVAHDFIRPSTFVSLIFAVLLSGCQGDALALSIDEVGSWTGEPLVLDPVHVQENAPALYDLLELAHERGWSGTSNDEDEHASLDYLREVSGIYENTFVVEYRGKVFHIGLESAH